MAINPYKPDTFTFLVPSNFVFMIDRIPNFTYFVQRVTFPGVTLGEAPVFHMDHDITRPGEKVTYDPLNINFLIDEQMAGWWELYDWMQACRMDDPDKPLSDAILTTYTNNGSTVTNRTRFTNCWPTMLIAIDLDTTAGIDVIQGQATFKFDTMERILNDGTS